MREIRFRAWNRLRDSFEEINDLVVVSDGSVQAIRFRGDEDMTGLQYVNLMQYTGLKDKNGVEIYEGDLIRVVPNNATGSIEWEPNGYWGVRLGDMIFSFAGGTDILPHTSEVIGNIYENPELLKKKREGR